MATRSASSQRHSTLTAWTPSTRPAVLAPTRYPVASRVRSTRFRRRARSASAALIASMAIVALGHHVLTNNGAALNSAGDPSQSAGGDRVALAVDIDSMRPDQDQIFWENRLAEIQSEALERPETAP